MSQKITIVTGRNLRGIARQMVEHPIDPAWYYSVLRVDGKVRDCRGGWRDRAECEGDATDHWPIHAAARALRAIPSERRSEQSRINGLKGGKPYNLRGGRPRKSARP